MVAGEAVKGVTDLAKDEGFRRDVIVVQEQQRSDMGTIILIIFLAIIIYLVYTMMNQSIFDWFGFISPAVQKVSMWIGGLI